MEFFVYILFSDSAGKFYKGQTNNVIERLRRHNNGLEISTKHDTPWQLVWLDAKATRSEEIILETKLKNIRTEKRGHPNTILSIYCIVLLIHYIAVKIMGIALLFAALPFGVGAGILFGALPSKTRFKTYIAQAIVLIIGLLIAYAYDGKDEFVIGFSLVIVSGISLGLATIIILMRVIVQKTKKKPMVK